MFIYAILVLVYYHNVSFKFKILELICVYLVCQWLKTKLSTWFHRLAPVASSGLIQPFNPNPPSVDIIMLSVTMIQTIHDTHRTEYELNSALARLNKENEYLREKNERMAQEQMGERENLERKKLDLERKLRDTHCGVDCLEKLDTQDRQSFLNQIQERPEHLSQPLSAGAIEPNMISALNWDGNHIENVVDSCGDYLDVIVEDMEPIGTVKGDYNTNDGYNELD